MSDSGFVGDELRDLSRRIEALLDEFDQRGWRRNDTRAQKIAEMVLLADVGLRQTLTPPAAPTVPKFVQRVNDGEQRMAAALAPFGWTCTEDFWRRYYHDGWVFHLANAVENLSSQPAFGSPPGMTATPRRRDAMTDEQLLIGLLWGEIPLAKEAAVIEMMRRQSVYNVWEEALDAAMGTDA